MVQQEPGEADEIHFCEASLLPQEAERNIVVQGFGYRTSWQDARNGCAAKAPRFTDSDDQDGATGYVVYEDEFRIVAVPFADSDI